MKRVVVACLAAGLVAVACTGADTRAIEADLDAQAQAQTSLRQRIGDVEAALQALSGESGSGQQELRTVAQRLTDLEDALDALSTLLSEEKAARESADTNAAEGRASLDTQLSQLESRVNALEGELNGLRNLVNALQARLDDHENGHP